MNHILPKEAAGFPTVEEALPEIQAPVGPADCVCGYNTGFDLAFLERAGSDRRWRYVGRDEGALAALKVAAMVEPLHLAAGTLLGLVHDLGGPYAAVADHNSWDLSVLGHHVSALSRGEVDVSDDVEDTCDAVGALLDEFPGARGAAVECVAMAAMGSLELPREEALPGALRALEAAQAVAAMWGAALASRERPLGPLDVEDASWDVAEMARAWKAGVALEDIVASPMRW